MGNLLKIAITGNIASGKSQIEKFISDKFPVYDADKIAHSLLDECICIQKYDVYTDTHVDRKKLGEIVYSNPVLKESLEKEIHPMVKNEIFKLFEKHKNDNVIFISVPLLFEAKFDSFFDKIIFVSAPKDLRTERLMNRNNFTPEEAITRIEAQESEESKIPKCDWVIENNSSIQELEKQIKIILKEINSIC